jgi:hypothetical protein
VGSGKEEMKQPQVSHEEQIKINKYNRCFIEWNIPQQLQKKKKRRTNDLLNTA